jgi:hypothetical protein
VPQMSYPIHQGSQFSLVVRTAFGKHYTLEYKDALAAANWTGVATVRGNGALQFLIDATATTPGRYYRVRQW